MKLRLKKRFFLLSILFVLLAPHTIVHAQKLEKSLGGNFKSANILSSTFSNREKDGKGKTFRMQDETFIEEIAKEKPNEGAIQDLSDALGDSSLHYDEDARRRRAEMAVKRVTSRKLDKALQSSDLSKYYKATKKAANKMNKMVEVKEEHLHSATDLIPPITAGIDVPSGFNPSMHIGKNSRMYYDWQDQVMRFELTTRW